MKRSQVKTVHENAVLNNFKRYLSSQGKNLVVVSQPDPPDAIVTIDNKITWVEITDAFYREELAESITSYLASDKPHKPVPENKRVCIEPNQSFSDVLCNVIAKKIAKPTMSKAYSQYGSGILLVGIHTPFSTAKQLSVSERPKILDAIHSKMSVFKEIYFYAGSGTGSQFFKLL